MALLRLAAVLVILAALASPGALAAPAEGRLVVDGVIQLPGGIAGAIRDPTFALDSLPVLDLAAGFVTVDRYVERKTVQQSPLGPVEVTGEDMKETTTHGASVLRFEAAPGGEPRIGFALEGAATLAADAASLRPVGAVYLYGDGFLTKGRCAPGIPCLDAAGVHELVAPSLAFEGAGTVRLYLYNVLLTIEENGAATRYASGVGAGDSPLQQEDAELVVVLRDAQVNLAPFDGRLYASALTLETDRAVFTGATGSLDVGVRKYLARDDRVEAFGRLVLEPAAVPPAPDHGAVGEPAYAETVDTRIRGDVVSLNLAAVPIHQDRPAETAGLAALLAAAVAALAYFWPHVQFHGASLLAPLYTRLQSPKLLDNDVRSHIYDIIRSNPGISARAIHRESSQSWGTVVYHLRQLESHHLVVSRRFGRARNYYENHGKYRGMEQQLACLRSSRARALAHAILREPGITQEGLAEASGLAQPTTSYYARKLTGAQLVREAREGRYVRYLPLDDLERFIRLAEQAESVDTDAPSPAQA